MMTKEIEEKLIQGIASIMSRDLSADAADVPLHALGIDSLGFVEILVYIEKTFQLNLVDSDLTKKDFETVHSLATFLSNKL